MGEKKETKNEGDQKAAMDGGGDKESAADGGEKKEVGPITVVLKLDLHCQGCAKKVRRSISHLEGVEKVKADWDAKKLTVTGNVDPSWLRDTVEFKTKKKVELIFPQPKKDGGIIGATAAVADKKGAENPVKKTEENNKKPKEAVISTVVMKIKLHCDGCAQKIKRIIIKNIDGVTSVTTDFNNDVVTVIGTMDVNELTTYLKEKLRREVQIVPSKISNGDKEKKKEEVDIGGGGGGAEIKAKEGGGKGGECKEKESESGGDIVEGKMEKEATTNDSDNNETKECELKLKGERNNGGNVAKFEVNKMEHRSYETQTSYAATPMYDQAYANHDYGMAIYHHQSYSNSDYVSDYTNGPPPPPPTYLNTNGGIFSDENPNGCFIM